MNDSVGMTSEDIKYVMNSIISALDFSKLDMEDKEDILTKIEDEESDYGMEGDDLDMDLSGDDELDLDMGMELDSSTDGEMGEGDVVGVYSNIKKQRNEEMTEDEKVQTSISKIMDGIFGESNVDKVLEKYFLVSESEKKTNTKKKNKSISVVSLAESIEQKTAVEFMLSESKELKFLGKTNKGNLIFEHQGKQIKVTTEGEVL